ncbi:MAG: L,D-transpeptidase [Sphingomonas bacterium]|nr:L,D-transpeptidase [Sphingomonas bacterium]
MIERVGRSLNRRDLVKPGRLSLAKAATRSFGVCLGLLVAAPVLANSGTAGLSPPEPNGGKEPAPYSAVPKPRDNFVDVKASEATRQVANWVVATGDNLELPFLIVDKIHAQVFAFSADGKPRGSNPILIGLARGDTSTAGIGQRRLADIAPADRTTPAGRFVAALGNDLGPQDIVWVDYDNGISLHRVVRGNVADRRLQRLASTATSDNRITYGCINVPANFFDSVVRPLLKGTNGMVYILPEVRPLRDVFAIPM